MSLLLLYLALSAAALLVIAWAIRPREGAPLFSPQRQLVSVGVVLLGVSVGLWILGARVLPNTFVYLIFPGTALFALGWVGVGVGLRPRGSSWRGGVAAAGLYFILGYATLPLVGESTGRGTPFETFTYTFTYLENLGFAAMWPFALAHELGLLGETLPIG